MLNALVRNLSKYPRFFSLRLARPFSTLEAVNPAQTAETAETEGLFLQEDDDEGVGEALDIDFGFLSEKMTSLEERKKSSLLNTQVNQKNKKSLLFQAIAAVNLDAVVSNQDLLKQMTFSEFHKLLDMKCETGFLAIFRHPKIELANKLSLFINLDLLQTPQHLAELITTMYESNTQEGKEDLEIVNEKLVKTAQKEMEVVKKTVMQLYKQMIRKQEKTPERLNLLIFLSPNLFNDYLTSISLNKNKLDKTIFEALKITDDPDIQARVLTKETANYIARNSSPDSIELFIIAIEFLAKQKATKVSQLVLRLLNTTKEEYWTQLLSFEPQIISKLTLQRKLVLYHIYLHILKKPVFTEAVAVNCRLLLQSLGYLKNHSVKVMLKKFLCMPR